MRPQKPKTTGEGDLFRARLDQIINMKHELVKLAGEFALLIGIGALLISIFCSKPSLAASERGVGVQLHKIGSYSPVVSAICIKEEN